MIFGRLALFIRKMSRRCKLIESKTRFKKKILFKFYKYGGRPPENKIF